MFRPRTIIAALAATIAVTAASCSDSPDAVTTDVGTAPVVTETIDLADGAFERNESQTGESTAPDATAASAEPATTDEATIGTSTSVVAAEPATTDANGGGGSTDTAGTTADGSTSAGATTGGSESADDAATTGSSSDGGTTSGATTGSTGDDNGNGTATDGDAQDDASNRAAVTEPGTGLVRVDSTDYSFATDVCTIDESDGETSIVVLAEGTLVSGVGFEVELSFDLVDEDGDGQLDETFDLFVDHAIDDDKDVDVPELFAFKSVNAGGQLGGDVEVTVSGTRISGTGPIADFNGIAIPLDETAPMSFDVLCP